MDSICGQSLNALSYVSNNHHNWKNRRDIYVTHFINPHLFWFRYTQDYMNNALLKELERRMEESSRGLQQRIVYTRHGYQAIVGELVAVMHLKWVRWIRVQVDEIRTIAGGRKLYCLWSIDYGVPIEADDKWIRPLPLALQRFFVPSVYIGGIANILPSVIVSTVYRYVILLILFPMTHICSLLSFRMPMKRALIGRNQ